MKEILHLSNLVLFDVYYIPTYTFRVVPSQRIHFKKSKIIQFQTGEVISLSIV